jgi:hypothetical protein
VEHVETIWHEPHDGKAFSHLTLIGAAYAIAAAEVEAKPVAA